LELSQFSRLWLPIAFGIITTLHIVLGELAPKSLALQRSEGTALWVVRPLGLFRFLLQPAIVALNGLGNLLLRLCGLRPGTAEESLHSPEELRLLIAASQEAGLLQAAQQEVFERVLNIGNRRISDIMTVLSMSFPSRETITYQSLYLILRPVFLFVLVRGRP
jgi:magnesium and cobalt exporter, CNNM family